MRVLFVIPHPIEGPSSRFRVYQFLPYLRTHEVEVTVRPFMSSRLTPVVYQPGRLAGKALITAWGTLKRAGDALAATRYDLVYVLREAFPFGPPLFERLLDAAAGRLVFDFDDSIWMPSLAYSNPLDRLRDFGKPAKVIGLARHIVVGSEYLRRYALRFALQPERVTVIPTVVDTATYRPAARVAQRARIIIGWIGTARGSSYLRELVGVMTQLAQGGRKLAFKFVGAEPFDTAGLAVEFKPWRLEDEVADLQSFDIGIMPLTYDEETRGKCGFKLIQYMAVGIPVVCSPVGANLDIVEEGGNGFFARTPQEWLARLQLLIENDDMRVHFGARGRELAEARFSLAAMAPRLLAVLREAAA